MARVRLLLADEQHESSLVMRDVEGSEFCLDSRVAPQPGRLAAAPGHAA